MQICSMNLRFLHIQFQKVTQRYTHYLYVIFLNELNDCILLPHTTNDFLKQSFYTIKVCTSVRTFLTDISDRHFRTVKSNCPLAYYLDFLHGDS